MENIFDKNIQVLRQHDPLVDQILLAASESGSQVEVYETDLGYLNLDLVKTDGVKFAVHRLEDPLTEVSGQLPKGWQKEFDILAVVGTGFLYHLAPLILSEIRARILVIEPEPLVLAAALPYADLTSILQYPSIRLVLGDDPQKFSEALGEWYNCFFQPKVRLTALESYSANRPALMNRLKEIVDIQDEQACLRINSHRSQGSIPLRNILVNICRPEGQFRIGDLSGSCSGMPALVVNSGPSLNKNGHLIKHAAERAVILAAASSLSFLQDFGIKPDILLMADPSPINVCHIKRALDGGSLLVYDPSSDPETVSKLGGVKVLANCGHMLTSYIEKKAGSVGYVRTWGSVTTFAMEVGIALGCEPVVHVGLDLSFENLMFQHFLGYESPPILPADRLAETVTVDVKDIFSGSAKTTTVMQAYLNWIVSRTQSPGAPRIINATEGGIFSSAELYPLNQLILGWGRRPPKPSLADMIQKSAVVGFDLVKLRKLFKKDIKEFEKKFVSIEPVDYPFALSGLDMFNALKGIFVDEALEMENAVRTGDADPSQWRRLTSKALSKAAEFKREAVRLMIK